ncbi:methionyl-tRNA formyltransferase [Candidatus Binatia bacterium]|nr:methionyl-tRNA formyltransferase [Candidatus Binatia bacterium]
MRIVLIGQAAFAERVLDGLRANGHEVLAVYCPPDGPAGKPDPVKVRAGGLGIPVRQHASLKRPEVRSEIEPLRADLGVLAYVTQIVPPSVFEVPRLGSICFHPSLLPRYRGGSAVNWQIIKGETEAGVSVFWVDPGIDTGPVLLQKPAPIRPDDTAGSLYYDTLFPLGVDAVLESVELIAAGRAPRLVQDQALDSYDPLCRDEHALVDWHRPLRDVYNLIRGCDPQPGAFTMFRGQKLRLYDACPVPGETPEPGAFGGGADDGILVGAGGGAVRIKRVRWGDVKIAAAQFVLQTGIGTGTVLG